MSPKPKFDYKPEYNYLEWFEKQAKLRDTLGLPGHAFGYRKALEAFREAGEIPCRFIPDKGNIIRQMVDALPMMNMLELLKQTSWYYLEVKYGRDTMDVVITGVPRRALVKLRRNVPPKWTNEQGIICGTDYDHAGKITDLEFYAMLEADISAYLTQMPTRVKPFMWTDLEMQMLALQKTWQDAVLLWCLHSPPKQ